MIGRPSILLVDDEVVTSHALAHLLRGQGYQVTCADSASEALRLLEQAPIEVIIADDEMPDMSGVELLAVVRRRYPRVMRLVLTGRASLQSTLRSINESDVFRYLIKPCPTPELFAAVAEALEVQAREELKARVLEKALEQARLIEEASWAEGERTPEPPPAESLSGFASEKMERLSEREREVLDLLAAGERVASIARQLFISVHTVRNHVKAIFRKLDVHSKTEILQRARPAPVASSRSASARRM